MKYRNSKDIRSHVVFMLLPLHELTERISQDFPFFHVLTLNPKIYNIKIAADF